MLKRLFLVWFLGHMVIQLQAQGIPDRTNRLVNDYAGVLTSDQAIALENQLIEFQNQTSTQVAIVIVPSLDGYDPGAYAFELGEKWGVGQKGKNNGIIILVKPKTQREKGQAYIATGYGLEGAVPDAYANQIIDNEMIPRFRQNDYVGGIQAAVNVIIKLTKDEYKADQYFKKNTKGGAGALIVLIVIVFIVVLTLRSKGSKTIHHSGSSLPFWLLLGGMAGNSRSHGSWGNFSSGSGGFGGGGFGGFGGGSFGGGGAGGSW